MISPKLFNKNLLAVPYSVVVSYTTEQLPHMQLNCRVLGEKLHFMVDGVVI